jgi:hypothetical protein
MERFHPFLDVFEMFFLGLDDEKPFPLVPDFPFPSVDGSNGGDKVDTSGEMLLDQSVGNLQRLFFRAASD